MTRSIPLLTLESRIKRGLRTHLRNLGFKRDANGLLCPPAATKEAIRLVHQNQRCSKLSAAREFVGKKWPQFSDFFADGCDVIPSEIEPHLEAIQGGTWQSELFRLATLTWSIPVSEGFGRRIRFLVWDKSRGKLIGLIALGDPVFNLGARDRMVGWDSEMRKDRLVHVMDAFVLGAIPPYNFLLGGKLVACLIRTREVLNEFKRRYSSSRGIISGKRKHASLAMVTTTSALGRSSVYNRLVLDSIPFFRAIGFTKGFGHFHVPDDLFSLIREYLAKKGHEYAGNNRFGDGPNWKFRAIRHILPDLGMNRDLLRHGIGREVFVSELASNARELLLGTAAKPKYEGLHTVAQVADLARKRWLEPRAVRRPDYSLWNKQTLLTQMMMTTAAQTDRAQAKSS